MPSEACLVVNIWFHHLVGMLRSHKIKRTKPRDAQRHLLHLLWVLACLNNPNVTFIMLPKKSNHSLPKCDKHYQVSRYCSGTHVYYKVILLSRKKGTHSLNVAFTKTASGNRVSSNVFQSQQRILTVKYMHYKRTKATRICCPLVPAKT